MSTRWKGCPWKLMEMGIKSKISTPLTLILQGVSFYFIQGLTLLFDLIFLSEGSSFFSLGILL
jgi:hypothetical protein